MAKFYGTLRGNREVVSRCGSTNSGIRASVQSYDGSITIGLYYNDKNQLMVCVEKSNRSRVGGELIFCGTFGSFVWVLQHGGGLKL